MESYQAQVKARDAVPEAMAAMARELEKTREELQQAKEELAIGARVEVANRCARGPQVRATAWSLLPGRAGWRRPR
ncbi:hypothetical protein [Streptomyces sp. 7N604]|uniref:hypothetical protein n=1 Tax=Streptomyces sp. 7N604 TaxID=3457415 RepID=UPI003FD62144